MFEHIKIGDIVVRDFLGMKQQMRVTEVSKGLITAGMGWTFDIRTGMEVDHYLHYGPEYGRTCSFLIP